MPLHATRGKVGADFVISWGGPRARSQGSVYPASVRSRRQQPWLHGGLLGPPQPPRPLRGPSLPLLLGHSLLGQHTSWVGTSLIALSFSCFLP